jgi:hypothetical protein
MKRGLTLPVTAAAGRTVARDIAEVAIAIAKEWVAKEAEVVVI